MKLAKSIANWPILEGVKWSKIGMKWTQKGMKWIWEMAERPYKKYKQNKHLQRNIYWCFRFLLQC